MTTTFNKLLFTLLVFTAIISVTSCRKDKFDEPKQITEDPNLDTISISRLRAMYTGGSPKTITEEVTISGIVVGNDISGNIFEQIFIDDGNSAMPILIDRSALYGDFPVGRKIYVKCKGLVLGTYGGFLQLGGYANGVSVEGIPANLITKYIVKGPTGYNADSLAQTITNINDLNNSYHGRLIKLMNVEFDDASTDVPFADVNLPSPTTGERFLRTCSSPSTTITVRNSAYSKFAFTHTPKGNGTAYGIYSIYNSEKQLLLRDITDLSLTNFRCDGTDPNEITIFSENFNSIPGSNNGTLNVTGWKNITELNSALWQNAIFGPIKCAKIDSYNATDGQIASWLITPSINLGSSASKKMKFMFAPGKADGVSSFKVLISTNYDGTSTSPQTFTWTTLADTICTTPVSSYGTLAPFRTLDLSAYSGNVYVAFKYDASKSGSQQRTIYELDDVKISGL